MTWEDAYEELRKAVLHDVLALTARLDDLERRLRALERGYSSATLSELESRVGELEAIIGGGAPVDDTGATDLPDKDAAGAVVE